MPNYRICYFSGTGNTKLLTELCAAELNKLGAETEIFDIRDGKTQIDDEFDKLIIAYPVHGFNAPLNVLEFVRSLPLGRKRETYIIKSSGEPLRLNDASSRELAAILKALDYRFMKEYHFVMPYNMIFRHSDEMASKMYLTAKNRMPAAVQGINRGEKTEYKPPFFAVIAAAVCKIEHSGMRFNGRFYKVDKNKCIKCGLCERNCPMQNIKFSEGKFSFGKNCIGCAKCAFNCPTDAFFTGLTDFMKVNGKYDFGKNADDAVIGKFCRNSYIKYFAADNKS